MKKLLNLTAFLLILACVLSACKKPDDTKIDYPINVPFTEYALDETSCQWQNLPYDEKVILINSNAALEKYISCAKSSYPVIDFSKNSLLLVSGKTTAGVDNISKTITQLSADLFKIDIEIALAATPEEEWCVALIVAQLLNEDTEIQLHLSTKDPKVIFPIAVDDDNINTFFKNALVDGHSSCLFPNISEEKDTCILIQNFREFQQLSECEWELPEIDFDKYTLIIGKVQVPLLSSYIAEQKIIENSALTLFVRIHVPSEGMCEAPVRYHWGIYPKLPDKPFSFEYIFVHLDE